MTDASREPAWRMALACKTCNERWPDDAPMEALLLHFQVEHDTDKVTLNLLVVCACNTAMTFERTEVVSGGFLDHFDCPSDGAHAAVPRSGAIR